MLTNQLIEDGDNHYYVDANGVMVKNTWVAVPADDNETLDVEYRWYYFGSTGKAYKKSYGKTINGKKYGFDEDGKMLFGYVDESSYIIKNDEEDPILDADYYFGTNEDGARHTGWLQYTDALANYDWDYYWFYFNTSNGKKVKDQVKTINGKKYSFKDNGIMNKEWALATIGNDSTTAWFHGLSDGSLAKNQWIWHKPDENMSLHSDDYSDETQRWFRTNASGQLVKGQTKKVNSKWYVFDPDGVMLKGLVVLDQEGVSNAHPEQLPNGKYAFSMDDVTKSDIVDLYGKENGPGERLHYFSNDEEHDGSMKTGTMKIELADDTYTFSFKKTTGSAKHGYNSSDKKVYNNGILEKGGDDKYKVKTDLTTGTRYLVGTSGSVVTSTGKYKDANDYYYVYIKGADAASAKIAGTSNEDTAKKAVAQKSFDGLGMDIYQ
jgi:glucan-binding YG repeat protein